VKKLVIIFIVLLLTLQLLVVSCRTKDAEPSAEESIPPETEATGVEGEEEDSVTITPIEVTSVEVTPALVLPGQEATVEADIANRGEAKSTHTVTLAVNSVEMDTRLVT